MADDALGGQPLQRVQMIGRLLRRALTGREQRGVASIRRLFARFSRKAEIVALLDDCVTLGVRVTGSRRLLGQAYAVRQ